MQNVKVKLRWLLERSGNCVKVHIIRKEDCLEEAILVWDLQVKS